MRFLQNMWYVAALPRQIGRELTRRVLLGKAVVLYRKEDGAVVALADRCPHRFAPLSRGALIGDVVQCKYHGLRFASTGECVHNPHGDVIAPNARVRDYPIEERHDLVWIWMGDRALADATLIPNLDFTNAPGHRTVHNHTQASYRYDILVDNLMDLSHADYLHVGTFMGGSAVRSETCVREEGEKVVTVFRQWDAPSPPQFQHLGPRVDQQFEIRWHPSQVMTFEYGVATPGGDPAAAPKTRFCHIATTETADTTHYFMSFTRDFAIDSPEVDAEIGAFQLSTILNEDSPMLEAVDGEMDGQDLLEMRPLVLPTDVGGLRVRRVMQRLLAEEAGNLVDRDRVIAA